MSNGARLARQTRAAARIARANFGRLPQPLKVNLAVTYWCQYQCKTCNIWRRQPTDELTTAELLAFIQQNPRVSWLDLTGGEIFLRDDIREILEAILSSWRDLAVLHFPTNGFLTDRIVDAARRIAGRGPDVIVTVSLDGDEALNDEVRGIKGGFRRQMETFKALRAISGVHTVLGMTLSSYNVGQFERTFDACRRECPDLGMEEFHLNLAQVSDHYYGNAGDDHVLVPREAAARELRLYRARRAAPASLMSLVENRFLNKLETFLESGSTPMRCHALRSSCFIDPWGTVFPCISYTRPLGRLRETGMRLDPIWNDLQTRRIQREIWSGDCPQCWTACEAYQSILGNLIRPFDRGPRRRRLAGGAPADAAPLKVLTGAQAQRDRIRP